MPDFAEIATGLAEDCNANGIPDRCEMGYREIVLDGGEQSPIDAQNSYTMELGRLTEALGPVTISVLAVGDFDGQGESASLLLNGLVIDELFDGPSHPNCSDPTEDSVTLSAGAFNMLLRSGGLSTLTVEPNAFVGVCGNSSMAVRVEYVSSLAPIILPDSDCNANRVPDECDIASGTSLDRDRDGVPDECQIGELFWYRSETFESIGSPFASPRVTLDNVPRAVGDVRFQVLAAGDLSESNQFIRLILAGRFAGSFFNSGGPGCERPEASEAIISAEAFNHMVDPDGQLVIVLEPIAADGRACAADHLTFEMEYLAASTRHDCNGNGIPDNADLESGVLADCDGDGVPDACANAERVVATSPWLMPFRGEVPQEFTLGDAPAAVGDVSVIVRSVNVQLPPSAPIYTRLNGIRIPNALISTRYNHDLQANEDRIVLPASAFNTLVGPAGVATIQLDPAFGVQTIFEPRVQIELDYFGYAPDVDCNGNGVDDACEIARGLATDCDGNGVPDECETTQRVAASFQLDVSRPFSREHPREFALPETPPAATDVRIRMRTNAIAPFDGFFPDLYLNGVEVFGDFWYLGDLCEATREITIVLPASQFNGALATDGEARFALAPSFWTTALCPDAHFDVDVEYWTRGSGDDCNRNGVPDACDLANGTSLDIDGDGHLDECSPSFAMAWPASEAVHADAPAMFETGPMPPASGDVLLRVTGKGDFGGERRYATIEINGWEVAKAFRTDAEHVACVPTLDETIAIPWSQFNMATYGRDTNTITVTPEESPTADVCADAWVSVMLEYPAFEPVSIDCNGNAIEDADDIASGESQDCNANGIPDECEFYKPYYTFSDTLEPFDYDHSQSYTFKDMPLAETYATVYFGARGSLYSNWESFGATINGVDFGPQYDDFGPGDCSLDDHTIAFSRDEFNGLMYGRRDLEVLARPNRNVDPIECSNIIFRVGFTGGGDLRDCNNNGVPDECDIASGLSDDCDGDGKPDECEIASQPLFDCNGNGVLDPCDIERGTSEDCNGNGLPDECDLVEMTHRIEAATSRPFEAGTAQRFNISNAPRTTGRVDVQLEVFADIDYFTVGLDLYLGQSRLGEVYFHRGASCDRAGRGDISIDADLFNNSIAGRPCVELRLEPIGDLEYCPQAEFIVAKLAYRTNDADANHDGVPDVCQRCHADIACEESCVPGAGDGLVTITDFSCFLAAWATEHPAGDVTRYPTCVIGAGGDGHTLEDVSCFLSAWAEGCP
ncbi:MAG: GC-type dockerin domain-anchored protein [Planctomycetota bacterium]